MTKLQVDALPAQAAQMPRAYGLAMLGGERCFVADDPAELVAVIINGYENFDDTEAGRKAATVARLHSSIEAANIIQSSLLASAVQADTFDAEEFDELQLTAVMGDRATTVAEVAQWHHESVPLVLIATDYAPYTDRPAPTGDVAFINPIDELTFLRTAADIGIIEFMERDA